MDFYNPLNQQISIDYTDIMTQLSSDFIRLYAIYGCIVLFYAVFNIFIVDGVDFKYKTQLKEAFNFTVLLLSIFVCTVSIQYYLL